MKNLIVRTLTALLVLVVLGGLGAAYVILGNQDRGMNADGSMAPPASVRGTPEAPKFDSSKASVSLTAENPAEYQLPTDFKLPTDMDISTPQVPDGLAAPANGQKQ